MKAKIVFTIILLVHSTIGKSQATEEAPCWYDPYFDWTDNSNTNWQAKISGGVNNVEFMGSPFENPSTATINSIALAKDYLPEQGWVLMFKNFGCLAPEPQDVFNATPIFVLYNKYRSIIRYYFYFTNDNRDFNGSFLELKWLIASNNTGLLTSTNNYFTALKNYPLADNNEKLSNIIKEMPNNGGWFATDFNVMFDPRTDQNAFAQQLTAALTYSTKSNVEISGDLEFTTVTAKNSSDLQRQSNQQDNTLDDIETGVKKVMGVVPERKDLENIVENYASAANGLAGILRDSSNVARKLISSAQNISSDDSFFSKYLLNTLDVATGIGDGILGGIGVVSTVFDLFTGKASGSGPSQVSIQPTISKGSITLNGSITTESNPVNFIINNPGTKQRRSDGTIFYPSASVYNCPLGTFSLEEMPKLKVREIETPNHTGYDSLVVEFELEGLRCNPDDFTFPNVFRLKRFDLSYLSSKNGKHLYRATALRYPSSSRFFSQETGKPKGQYDFFESYTVTGNIKGALNHAAGVEMEDVKFALVFKIDKTEEKNLPRIRFDDENYDGKAFYDVASTVLGITRANCSLTNVTSVDATHVERHYIKPTYINHAVQEFNDGNLIISEVDPDGAHTIQTPFIDSDKFEGTSINLPRDGVAQIYLKVLTTLRPTDSENEQTPVVLVQTYTLESNDLVIEDEKSFYEKTCEQVNSENIVKEIGSDLDNTVLIDDFKEGRFVTVSNVESINSTIVGEKFVKVLPNSQIRVEDVHAKSVLKIDAFINESCKHSNPDAFTVENYFIDCDTSPLNINAPPGKLSVQPMAAQTIYKASENDLPNSAKSNFETSPNPSENGSFELKIISNTPASSVLSSNMYPVMIQVFDLTGKLMNQRTYEYEQNISMNGFAKGMYIISATFSNGQSIRKRHLVKN